MSFETLEKTRSRAKITASANSDLDIVRGKYSDLVAEDDEYIEEVSIDKVVVSGANNICKIERGSNTVAVFDRAGVFDFAGNGVSLDKDSTAALKVKFLNSSSPGTVTIYLKKKTKLDLSDFYPTELFTNLENGGWYDPSDLTSMFIGRNGSGGNPGAGDVVGMILDKRYMGRKTAAEFIAAQSEISPFTGDADEGYTHSGTTATFSDGVLSVVSNDGSYDRIEINLTGLTVGTYYRVSMRIRQTVGDQGYLSSWTWATVPTTYFSADWAEYEFLLPATAASGLIRIYAAAGIGDPGDTIEIGSVSVKAIPGNHLVAPSDAARPVLRDEVAEGTAIDLSAEPELLTNGTFETDLTGWTADDANGTVAVSGGKLSLTGGAGTVYASQSFPTTEGAWYLATVDTPSPGSNVHLALGTFVNGQDLGYVSVGQEYAPRYYRLFQGTGDDVFFTLREFASTGPTVIDNVSVKEVPAAAARRWYLDFDGVDDVFQVSAISAVAMAAAAKVNDQSASGAIYILGGSNQGMILGGSSVSGIIAFDGTTLLTKVGKDTLPHVVGYYDNGGLYVDGTLEAAGSLATPLSITRVGQRQDLTNLDFNGRLYGAILVDRALATAERAAIEAYLAEKSGVILA